MSMSGSEEQANMDVGGEQEESLSENNIDSVSYILILIKEQRIIGLPTTTLIYAKTLNEKKVLKN